MTRRGWQMIVISMALGCIYAALCAQNAQPNASDTPRRTTAGNGPYRAPQVQFLVHRIGTDHAESLGLLDMNGDGRLDIVSGAYWYENPGMLGAKWERHQFRTVTSQGEVVSDAGEWVVDVNHDGRPDIVTVGWFTEGVWWWENPGKPDTMWTPHRITESNRAEGGWMADVNGDGVPDLVICHYGREGIIWIDFAGRTPVVHHVMGRDQDGHGIGVADINGDGKADILTEYGWLEQVDANHDQWIWHPDWNLGDAGFPIIGYDVNGDGKVDLIYGQGHSYGLYWMEQKGSPKHRQWVRHVIDDSFSESHALIMADIDGDGQPELITGKRYRGHLGNDPGAYDPNVIYYYKIDRRKALFTRYAIAVNTTASIGTQIMVADLDGDGDLDLATAGRTGVHVFENLRIDEVSPKEREREILVDTHWPWPGEGPILPLPTHSARRNPAPAGVSAPNSNSRKTP